MRIDFVVPRYGADVVGGAEFAARMLAEHLVDHAGVDVRVLTTCALDGRSWANELPAGERIERGVVVRRFAARGRAPDFDRLVAPILVAPERATPADEQRFLELQGPVSDELLDAVRASEADALVFSPYLFHPIVRGLPLVRDRAVLHAAAHDEAVLRMPMCRALFGAARAHVYYTHAEQQLVQARFPVATTPQIVLGLGVDDPPAPEGPADPLGLGDAPYLLCLGRVEAAKGTDALARLFARYKGRRPGPLRLVYVGPVTDRPPDHPDIVVAGMVDEATKWAVLRGATSLVSPSRLESFGLVLFEAWLAGTPVLVNAGCAATREHAERSQGGLAIGTPLEFDAAVTRIVADAHLRTALATAGAEYVRTRFAWPRLMERYTTFLGRLS